MRVAAALRDRGHGELVSYSRKVFIPLTQLCRDVCHYCTFAHPPRRGEAAYLDAEEVLAIARAGARAGCKEALFTLGDKPELRYGAAREALARLGHETTLSYLAEMAALVLKETGLLPHLNPGVMTRDDIDAAAQGVGVAGHHAGERRRAAVAARRAAFRLARQGAGACASRRIAAAGEAAVPFTTGILIGIGETRARAHRGAAGAARPARALRPHPGNHHPEFPRQARHAHGERAGARPRRASVDHRGGAADLRRRR